MNGSTTTLTGTDYIGGPPTSSESAPSSGSSQSSASLPNGSFGWPWGAPSNPIPVGNPTKKECTIAFSHDSTMAGQGNIFANDTESKQLGYVPLPDMQDRITAPFISEMRHALGEKQLRVMLFAGHGTDDGAVMCIKGGGTLGWDSPDIQTGCQGNGGVTLPQ